MEGLCRTANSCKAALVVGALRITCNGLCTAARFHTAEENPGCLLECHDGLDCTQHYNRCSALVDSLCSLWPGAGECISPTAIFNKFLFKIAVRSSRLCILVAGLLDAFVTAFNLQRTKRGRGLNFRELVYGRIKMMTALCPAWAHTYQTMCLGCKPEQLRPEALKPSGSPSQRKITMLPTCRTSKLTGIESPGWRLFAHAFFKLSIYGTELSRLNIS